MSGGFGKSRWGSGPWGFAERPVAPGVSPFATGILVVPFGQKFGRVPVSRFTGEPSSGPLSGSSGLIFFSAALLAPSSSNSVDFESVDFTTVCTDFYHRPPEVSGRLFRFGGGPGFGSTNLSRTNAALYRSQPVRYSAVATLVQTTPPGPTTVVKVF
jgi:hypothetical protein